MLSSSNIRYLQKNVQGSAYEACVHTHMPLYTPKTLEMYKKKHALLDLEKLQGMRQIARLKQNSKKIIAC